MSSDYKATCCVVGGGPAGMVLAYLLARAGIDVILLEKHADFFRDFRGDTIHPSTLEVLRILGLDKKFLELNPDPLYSLSINQNGTMQKVADLSGIDLTYKFVAFIPQWDFLKFLADNASKYPSFKLMMETEGIDLIQENGKVVGIKAQSKGSEFEIRADLVVATDGRHSTLRDAAKLPLHDYGVPIDVLWTQIPKEEESVERALGYIANGQFMVMLDRKSYYQSAYLIAKGQFESMKNAGLPAFRDKMKSIVPFASKGIDTIQDWDQVKLLSVRVDMLEKWHLPALLCIGDAAHAMSPVGGVGINLAIQDAVATANMLTPKLRSHSVTEDDLEAIQQRRTRPAAIIQKAQIFVHKRLFSNKPQFPIPFWLLRLFPFIGRAVAQYIGVGVLPEYPDLAVIDKR